VTSEGHPRTVFRRALERGNVLVAETTAREVGHIDLREAIELTALVALTNRARGERYAVRWLGRWLDAADEVTLDEIVLVAGALAALGGPGHRPALELLRSLATS
jgi:hypothetical protein